MTSIKDLTGADVRRTQTLHTSPTSEVYAATLESDGTPVVVKRTKITTRGEITRFEKEVALLLLCDHPHVIKPIAQIRSAPTYAFVLPLFTNGALFGVLHNSGRQLSLRGALVLMQDSASALQHLHEIGILHRDIKSDNVLLDDTGRAVLVDFNASERTTDIQADIVAPSRPSGGFFKQFVVGTLPYMAPELLRGSKGAAYTDRCDIYSTGIMMNEVLTQTIPYSDAQTEQVKLQTILEARYNYEQLTTSIAIDGLRPNQPEPSAAAPAPLLELTRRCWADAARARPTSAELLATLTELLREAGGEPPLAPDGARSLFEEATAEAMDTAAGPARADVEAGGGAAGSATAAAVEAFVRETPDDIARDGEISRALEAMRTMAAAAVEGATAAPQLRVGVEASVGKRGSDRMEDRHVTRSVGGLAVAAVFDGHNGEAAAHFCATHLPLALQTAWAECGAAQPAEALKASFWGLHRAFGATCGVAERSGATALAALCMPGRVLVANSGDCGCKLWRGRTLVSLAREHTCEAADERARVEAAGAEVQRTADGKLRVAGIIQVTRTIGDLQLQKHGLTPEPEIMEATIGPDDKALIMGSDGLWDVLTDERIVHCLFNTAKSPDMIAKRLIGEALDRGATDNVTVVVVFLRDVGLKGE